MELIFWGGFIAGLAAAVALSAVKMLVEYFKGI